MAADGNDQLVDDELVSLIEADLRDGDRVLASVLARLIQVEDRSVHLRQGYKSMFDFCTRRPRLSAGAAQRRLVAARLAKRYPRLLNAIRDGRIHLSAVELLKELFNETNVDFLIEKACGKSQRELELLVAQLRPRPDVPSRIRRLPEVVAATAKDVFGIETRRGDTMNRLPDCPVPLPLGRSGEQDGASARPVAVRAHERQAPSPSRESRENDPSRATTEQAASVTPSEPMRKRRRLKRFEALAPGRNKVQFTVSDPQRDRLEYALDLMSHANPSMDLAVLVDAALDLLIPALQKRRGIAVTARAPKERRTSETPTDVDAASCRQAWQGAGEQCTYVAPSGERCTGTAFLQVDHVTPKARGGSGRVLRILCGAHNRLMAKEILGPQFVESAKQFHQRQRTERKRARLEDGLRALGFDARELDAAVRVVERSGWKRPRDAIMQEALTVLRGGPPPAAGPGPPQ